MDRRYFLIDYTSAKYTYYQLQGLELLNEQDTVRILFEDEENLLEFQAFWQKQCRCQVLTEMLPENTMLCRVSTISWLLGRLCTAFPEQEIVLIAGNAHYCSLFRNYQEVQDNLFVYSSLMRYFNSTWKRKRSQALNSLKLPEEQKQKVAFWVRRAHCISDSGRRKYKTHNRIQNIVGNGRTLKDIWRTVRPFLD